MIPRIAVRNTYRQKRRTILTVLTMFGGFTLCSISIGWVDGTYNRIIDTFTRYQLGHVQIHRSGYLDRPSLYLTIDDYDDIAAALDDLPGTEMYTPRLFSAGLASVGEKSAGIRIVGIDPEGEKRATLFDRLVARGRYFSGPSSGEVLIGAGLARRLEAEVGDEFVIVSQGADGSIANDAYEIAGIVSSDNPGEDQMSCYLGLSDAQELLVLENRIHEVAVIGRNHQAARKLASRIEDVLASRDYDVAPWQEFSKDFYQAMQADKQGNWIMLVVITLVVAVGVLNTVLMSVLERTREYGLLRAVGTRPRQIFRLVIIEVLVMAVVSIALGAVVATAVNYSVSLRGIPMPQSFSFAGIEWSHMYSEINVQSYVIPATTVLLSAMFISIFPALRAARTSPARAMRAH